MRTSWLASAWLQWNSRSLYKKRLIKKCRGLHQLNNTRGTNKLHAFKLRNERHPTFGAKSDLLLQNLLKIRDVGGQVSYFVGFPLGVVHGSFRQR